MQRSEREERHPPQTRLSIVLILFSLGVAGCGPTGPPAYSSLPSTTLRVGFGLSTGTNPQAGLRQAIGIVSLEGLVSLGKDGRAIPWLAESWTSSQDGLTFTLRLRPNVKLHDGRPLTAEFVKKVLLRDLSGYIGPAFEDIVSIDAISEQEIRFVLRNRSAFLLEGLELPISEPGRVAIGTGAFYPASAPVDGKLEMLANPVYYEGKPHIDRIVFSPYSSVRSAWAELLRGRVDMLYEVGVDALDSLQPSSDTKVFSFQRRYAYLVILNVQRTALKDREFRRALNAAIDRDSLIANVLRGHGIPADSPVSPSHWAFDANAPRFRYDPRPVASTGGRTHPFTILYAEASQERLALVIQRELQAVGVDVSLQETDSDTALKRVANGDFDAFLADAVNAPTLVRPYLFWHSGGTYNWGHFSSPAVDAALDTIRHAADDVAYKAGVSAFQRAIVDDPPAIFLAWSQRARAVSTRFDVPVDAGRDILATLRLWRPSAAQPANEN